MSAEHRMMARLIAENEALREEVAQLQEALAPRLTTPTEWRLTRAEASLFCTLTTRDWIPRSQLDAAMRLRLTETPSYNLVSVRISVVRRKTRDHGVVIETVYGDGYRLLDRERWRALLVRLGGQDITKKGILKSVPRYPILSIPEQRS